MLQGTYHDKLQAGMQPMVPLTLRGKQQPAALNVGSIIKFLISRRLIYCNVAYCWYLRFAKFPCSLQECDGRAYLRVVCSEILACSDKREDEPSWGDNVCLSVRRSDSFQES
jgi:hypothetical protein